MKEPITVMLLDYAVTFGGSVTSLYHMLKGMNKAAVKPIFVSGQPTEYLSEKFSFCSNIRFIPKIPWVDNGAYLKIRNKWPFCRFQILARGLSILRNLYWLVFIQMPEAIKYVGFFKKHGVQVCHFNNWLLVPWIIAAKIQRIPSVGHLRGFVPSNDRTLRFLARYVDHHVAVSTAIQENLLQLGVPAERITLVHDAINLDEFNSNISCERLRQEFGLSPEDKTYGLFGRIVPWKGVREFVLAACEINKKIPDAVGFIIGDFSDGEKCFFEEMQNLTVELGLKDKIIFTGFRKDVPEMMALMDVIVHASIEPEPFGMVIIEGMAMGKPVVATRAGGPLDIVEDKQTGYLVEMKDSIGLGNAVTELLSNPSLCKSMGEKGRVRVETLFHNKLYAEKMEKLFRQLASSCGK